MNTTIPMHRTVIVMMLASSLAASAATHYVWPGSPNPKAPYTNWATATHIIQNAVDVSVAGDEIVVTNGVYATGGRAVYGIMTNRVAVDRAVTLRSVNGREVTVIQGYQVPGVTNGDGAIRCVYLADGAVLNGFTLTKGATRGGGDIYEEQSGGGLRCLSASALVTNCTLAFNSAKNEGGGVYSGWLKSCSVVSNVAGVGGGGCAGTLDDCRLTGNLACDCGGGAAECVLNRCTLTGNMARLGGGAFNCALTSCPVTANKASKSGGGVYQGTMKNCTVTGNWAVESGGGVHGGISENCIVYYNTAFTSPNHERTSVEDSCTTPLPEYGTGNITNEPALASASHLSAVSPCRGAGNAITVAEVDIDGEDWCDPPSMGCDEYHGGSAQGPLAVTAWAALTNVAVGCMVELEGAIEGQVEACAWHFGDGVVLSNRPYAAHRWTAPGWYGVVLRAYNESNPGGVSATVTVRVVSQPVYYVATGAIPSAPFATWGTAARTIQQAVDVAVPGSLIMVSNGIYATGGRAVQGGLTNRVAIYKPMEVRSLNGPKVTVIKGLQIRGTTNGDGAIRCAYLASGAVLSGFTLSNGATRAAADGAGESIREVVGGGLYGESPEAVATNCILVSNAAGREGGGAFGGGLRQCTIERNVADGCGGGASSATLDRCVVAGNSAGISGGGAIGGRVSNCALHGNSALGMGGGACVATLINCTIVGNLATFGGGVSGGTVDNCVVYHNTAQEGANYYLGDFNYSCSIPLPSGTGNIATEPGLASVSHLGVGSPCRGAGNPACVTGVDIDGEPWLSPPSMGCDEYRNAPLFGPLTVAASASFTNVAVGVVVDVNGLATGAASACAWDFGDGVVVSNRYRASHVWTKPGTYAVVLRAYNASNPLGVSTSVIVKVVAQPVYHVAAASAHPEAPYSSWATAAQTIQEAVDAASLPGSLVLVSNGIYAVGGRGVDGTMTNRVTVERPVEVRSLNGPDVTSIEGYQMPGAKTGLGSIRCVYLAHGAVLSGFTLTNGATCGPRPDGGDWAWSGGGLWCESAGATATNCILIGNSAWSSGGGAYSGTLLACVLSRNAAMDGGGADQSVLIRCSLAGNSASGSGGGARGGTLDHCVVSGNSASCGGGVSDGTVLDSTLATNSAAAYGGGASGSTLNGCRLAGNTASGAGGGACGGTSSKCEFSGNMAAEGGGASQAALLNCVLKENSASYGGGADSCALDNCALVGNSAWVEGGGAYRGTLNNCTISGNWAYSGGGASSATLRNCVIYYNTAYSEANYSVTLMGEICYSCTLPLPPGAGNMTNEPALVGGYHLSSSSPCRGAGAATHASGVDIDGEAWLSTPSMGCDEYRSGSVTGDLFVAVNAVCTNVARGYAVDFAGMVIGRASAGVWDFGDGVILSNRPFVSHSWAVEGEYAVTLRAYNDSHPGGVSATVMVRVEAPPVHYVAADSLSPAAPYASWETAARTIQDAVDAATVPGALVLVSNGVYATGGRVAHGQRTTNRVAVCRAIEVRSVNGPTVTAIQGHQVPVQKTGKNAVRCAYLCNGAVLSGFTLTNGATSGGTDQTQEGCGGGLLCESTAAVATNCVMSANAAWGAGGGAWGGTLNNCSLIGNSASGSGGGASEGNLNNCVLTGNFAHVGGGAYGSTLSSCVIASNLAGWGGGVHVCDLRSCLLNDNSAETAGGADSSTLVNCTVTGNSATGNGGVHSSTLRNCIVYLNTALSYPNHSESEFSYCCTTPLPMVGAGNVSEDPGLVGTSRLAEGSLCRGAGNFAFASGVDINGRHWLNPPSMGCEEYQAGSASGDLAVTASAGPTRVAAGFLVKLVATVSGMAVGTVWDFGDGVMVSNALQTSHRWVVPGEYPVVFRAYNLSNPDGARATVSVRVEARPVHHVAAASASPAAPFDSWTTAAQTIQEAVDAASLPGALILVSNGVYATGGCEISGVGSNRVAVYKAVEVRSINGPKVTVIQGCMGRHEYEYEEADVRCAYLTNGAVLSGFTLTNGAALESGGGLWCESSDATASNCVLAGNSAYYSGGGTYGGGAYRGTLNNCILTGNSASSWGGGAYDATLSNCALTGNSAHSGGGAYGGTLNRCALTKNSAWEGMGGGVAFTMLNNCTLVANSADTGGGSYGSALTHCVLSGNWASDTGGGACDGRLHGCTVTGNSAWYGGGVAGGALRNCTVVSNSAWWGGGVYEGSLTNCIVFHNSGTKGTNYYESVFHRSCTVPLPTNGTGNITSEPLFLDLAGGNLRLQTNSPCIDAGDDAYALGGTDLDGNPRIVGGAVDMGAYEFQLNAVLKPVLVSMPATQSGAFQLRVTGMQGPGTFVLEVSTNLSTWLPVLTNTLPGATLDYTDPAATNLPCRFYRGVLR